MEQFDSDKQGSGGQPQSLYAISTFRELYSANLISNFGTQIQVVAAAWLMATITSSAQLVALVQSAMFVPVMMFSLLGGAMADSMDRRRLMLVAHLFMLAMACGLAVVTFLDEITPFILLGFTFLITAGRAINNPSWHASVRDIVPRSLLGRAVAMNSTSVNLARTAGPAIGGLIVSAVGVAVAFVVNALSFIGMLLALFRWSPQPAQHTTRPERIFDAVSTGIRYAVRSPLIRASMARGAVSGFSASAVVALIPVLARQELGGDASLFGLLMGAYGLGAVCGAFLGGYLREIWAMESVVRCATGVIAGGLVLLAFSGHAILAAAGCAASGAGWVQLHSSLNTTVQLVSPRWVSGRALSLYTSATFAAMAAGSWFFGFVADQVSVYWAFGGAGALLAVSAILMLGLRLPALNDMNVDPAGRWALPELDVEIDDKEGPIIVEIEYRIARDDVDRFLAAMLERERIRRRDGARDWQVWRDLQDEERWIESYRVSSWVEYIRHNQRRTAADMENSDQLAALDRGRDNPHRVRRYLKGVRRWSIEARRAELLKSKFDRAQQSFDPDP